MPIVHPLVGAASAARIAELSARGEPIACYEERPSWSRTGSPTGSSPSDRRRRPRGGAARPGDGARTRPTEEQAAARIKAQLPLAAKVAAADYVIDNGGSREETERRTDEVLEAIRRKARGEGGPERARRGLKEMKRMAAE